MEVKIRMNHEEGIGMNQWLGIVLPKRIPFLWKPYDPIPDAYVFIAGLAFDAASPPYRTVIVGQNPVVKVGRASDTCFFRASKRGLTINVSYSPDGVDYTLSSVSSVPKNQWEYRHFVIYLGNSTTTPGDFSASIDYVRFTPVGP
jgi:hypothetical protein